MVRPIISYPKLDDGERQEVLEEVTALITWLEEHQLNQHDFIRQTLIDGLKQFQFRIERLRWLGWGYALQSLKDVIGAYMALERGFGGPDENAPAEAMLKRVGSLIRHIYSKTGVAKDVYERGDFLIKAYGAAAMIANAKSGGITGLMTFSAT